MPWAPNLPSIRGLILPGEGWVFVDADFDRADAQIVAWSADEPELMAGMLEGRDFHTENTQLSIWTKNRPTRQAMKAGLHLTHYYGKEATLASTLGVPLDNAIAFRKYWFARFPGVARWHDKVKLELKLKHSVRNVWGFRRFYFDRINTSDAVELLMPQATAWLGQSGVAITINKAMRQVRERFTRDEVRLSLQVHDSLLLRVRKELLPGILPQIVQAMRVEVPFKPTPLFIPVSLKVGGLDNGSWGSVKTWKGQLEGQSDAQLAAE